MEVGTVLTNQNVFIIISIHLFILLHFLHFNTFIRFSTCCMSPV